MMVKIKEIMMTRHTRELLLVILALSTLFISTRLLNLTKTPIFTDEAIYIHWAHVGSFDPAWRFIPLTDGKPPLFHWIVMATIRVFDDPLLAGRIVSVAAGGLSTVFIGLLGWYLYKNKYVGYLASLLYIILPFTLVHDRLALVDSLLTTFVIVSLLLTVWLIEEKRLDTALLLGLTLGFGMLTKPAAIFGQMILPFSLILSPVKKLRNYISLTNLKWLSLVFLVILMAQGMFASLRLSEFHYRIAQKNQEFIIPVSAFIDSPLQYLRGNLTSLIAWQISYHSLPLVLAVVVGLSCVKYSRQNLWLSLFYFGPLIAIAGLNKIIFARYLLVIYPAMILITALGIWRILSMLRNKWQQVLVFSLLLGFSSLVSLQVIWAPESAAIPEGDRKQYFTSWTAGYGIKEVANFLQQEASDEEIYVGTQGTFGLMPYALELYTRSNPNIKVQSFWPVNLIPSQVRDQSARIKTFFVYNEISQVPEQEELELIMDFPRKDPSESQFVRLYRVLPKAN